MVRFAELAAGVQARVTVLVFPIDEVSDMDDITATVETLADTVDWVVVRNRAKIPRTKFFDGSEIEATSGPTARRFSKCPLCCPIPAIICGRTRCGWDGGYPPPRR